MNRKQKEKNYGAIVLAAGSGSRMHMDTPKQYLMVGDYPLMYYALHQFQESRVEKIVLVVTPGEEEVCRTQIVERYGFSKVCAIVPGGSERYLSVQAGLHALAGVDYVLIHDSARPCIDQALLERVMKAVAQDEACVAGMPVKDTMKVATEHGWTKETPDRSRLWQVQTPQAFAYDLISDAYDRVIASGEQSVTDDTQVLELAYGRQSRLIEGSYRNIKVTTPEDLEVVKIFLKNIK